MKTLKIGALALSVLAASSAVALPGLATLKAFAAGCESRRAALVDGYVSQANKLGKYFVNKNWLKTGVLTSLALKAPVNHPKKTAALAVVAVAAYFGYKKYKAQKKAAADKKEQEENDHALAVAIDPEQKEEAQA